jgi:sulfite reductase (NADPH) flavoprotein alpha-component
MLSFLRNKKAVGRKKDELLILYATKSGNAKLVAQQAGQFLKKKGMPGKCLDISKADAFSLQHVNKLLAVVSTDGEGEPPPGAEQFFNSIQSPEMPRLDQLQFAVCALGDSSYEKYCEAGKMIEGHLLSLKAKPLMQRVDCDLDFSKPASEWIKNIYKTLQNGEGGTGEPAGFAIEERASFTGNLQNQKILGTAGNNPLCFQVTLQINEQHFTCHPGDCLEIKPENPYPVVERILKSLSIAPDTMVDGDKTIAGMLLKELEVTRLSKPVLLRYASFARNKDLEVLLQSPEKTRDFIHHNNLADLIAEFPAKLKVADLAALLPKIAYRQYTIASTLQKNPLSVDLILKEICTGKKGGHPRGAASTYLCHTLLPGQPVQFRHVACTHFHLPENTQSPIIMIANGTGIAPFRAFLQELGQKGRKDQAWLVFGEKTEKGHFYWKHEWDAWLQKGILTHLDTAFSRDQQEKRYVQHVLEEKQERLMQWISNGGHIYVCGSKKMGKKVSETMDMLLRSVNLSVTTLKEQGLYHEDVY